MTANKTCATSNENGLHSEKGERRKEKGEPTPNRVQSSLLELPRCEGGKDDEVGLKENRRSAPEGTKAKGESLATCEAESQRPCGHMKRLAHKLSRLLKPVIP